MNFNNSLDIDQLNQLSFLTKYIFIVDSVASSQTWLGGDGAWCFSEAGHWQHQRGHQRWLAITQKTCCFASPHRNIDIALIADSGVYGSVRVLLYKSWGKTVNKKKLDHLDSSTLHVSKAQWLVKPFSFPVITLI